ncbi:centrosome-associated protein 350 [Conger conger]|uniref:centrosome-associated protein 350 n=1 Tax=Conger conger TaxID=82655 RepID=UPI002A59EF7C|nr:centrosome-associated protein 350 [Conger conger]
MDVRPALCADPQKERVGAGERCINDLDTLVDSLMGKLLMEVVNEAKEVRTKYRGRRSTLKKENHIQKPQALGTGDGSPAKQSLNPNLRPSPPCLSDQWRCSLASAAQPRVRVEPHDPGVVSRLVAESVEALWCQTGGCVSDSCDAPAYLASEESRRAYRQVIFDLTSDIYHKALRCHWGTSTSPWELKETSSVSPVWSSRTSLSDVKAAVLAEVRRELNLERTDVQTREMMQNLSKYRTAHRDRVDYVLIQELHKEEQQWVDYSLDQLSVKMQLTEDLFDILMQDTISVLNHIYTAPSGDSPPALQPSQSSLIP